MTPDKEIQELRDWSARKMGWVDVKANFKVFYNQWLPDRPESGQIWMLVERMRELGWYFVIGNQGSRCRSRGYIAEFWNPVTTTVKRIFDDNPCLAILKAAKATED